MKVEQISVFLENKSGRLSEVTRILGGGGINLRALTLADTTDFGILRLIVNDNRRAVELLKSAGFTVGTTEVVAVEIPDRPNGLRIKMGQYWLPVNLDRKEFIDPHKLECGSQTLGAIGQSSCRSGTCSSLCCSRRSPWWW